MFLAALHCSWFVQPSNHDVSLRAFGLGIMGVGILLAFISPVWFRDRWHARPAQLALGAYAILSVLALAPVALFVANSSTNLHGDEMSVEGIVLLLSAVLVTGGMLTNAGARALGTSRFNLGCLMALPTLACLVLDSLLLWYAWLAPSVPAGAGNCATITPGRPVWILAAASLVIALAAAGTALRFYLRDANARALVNAAVLPAAIGAALEVAVILVRGPHGWYAGSHLAGLDLMLASVAIGIGIFTVTTIRARRVLRAVPVPVRIR